MLKLDGQLYVRALNGRNGRFNIGRLVTPYGEFAVKDRAIEELDEGTYDGTFGIGKFFVTNSTLASGSIIVEQRVRLEELWLHDGAKLPADASVGVEETDPLDEETRKPSAPDRTAEAVVCDGEPESSQDEPSENEQLFGDLWPLGQIVKLDPSVARPKLRAQTNVLRDMGYRFNSKEKHWYKTPQAA